MKRMDEEKRKKRIWRLLRVRSERELRFNPSFQTHEALWAVAKKLPTDFEPWGKRDLSSSVPSGDCSCGCRWFNELHRLSPLPLPRGICAKPKSVV